MSVKKIINEWKCPEGATEKQKMWFEHMLLHAAQKKTEISVVYRLECGCGRENLVTLDRYPMPEGVRDRCPMCHKSGIAFISDPIVFHCRFTNEDIPIEKLKDYVFNTDHHQIDYLMFYIAEQHGRELLVDDPICPPPIEPKKIRPKKVKIPFKTKAGKTIEIEATQT